MEDIDESDDGMVVKPPMSRERAVNIDTIRESILEREGIADSDDECGWR